MNIKNIHRSAQEVTKNTKKRNTHISKSKKKKRKGRRRKSAKGVNKGPEVTSPRIKAGRRRKRKTKIRK